MFGIDDIHSISSPLHAAYLLNKNRVLFTFHALRNLENMPITFPSTEEILLSEEIGKADKISTENALKTRAFASGVDLITDAIKDGSFEINLQNILLVHQTIARHDKNIRPYELGKFRQKPVNLNNTDYRPPSFVDLNRLWESELPLLMDIEHPLERSLAIFLWLARTQFFPDCNKRTAILMINGELAINSCHPIIFPAEDQERFMSELRSFYNTGNATAMMRILREYAHQSIRMLCGDDRGDHDNDTDPGDTSEENPASNMDGPR